MEYIDKYNKPNDQIEDDDLITGAHESDVIRKALIDIWTVNPQLPDTSSIPNFQPGAQNQQNQVTVIADQTLPQLQVTPDGLKRFLPLSTNLPLGNNRKMLNLKLDFGELNIDGLIDTSALLSAISEADLPRIRIMAPNTVLNEGPLPEFHFVVANGQLQLLLQQKNCILKSVTLSSEK